MTRKQIVKTVISVLAQILCGMVGFTIMYCVRCAIAMALY